MFYDKICENVIDKRVELTHYSSTKYLSYSDIAFAEIRKNGFIKTDDLEIVDCNGDSHYFIKSLEISRQVLEALVGEGFKKINPRLVINPNRINLITLADDLLEENMIQYKNGKLDIETRRKNDIKTIYKLSLNIGIPVMLDSTFPINQLKEYKNYILKFKEKYPEKLLLYELNWKDDELDLFDYSILL